MKIDSITYHPQYLSREYGVNLYIKTEDKDIQRIQFNVNIQYKGSYDNGKSIFNLLKKDVAINRNESNAHLYGLAIECNKIFYPITIGVDQYGQLDMMQTNTIFNRWEKYRPEIERYYTGPLAEKYMNTIEASLQDASIVKLLVTSDLFFSQFFQLIYEQGENTTNLPFTTQSYLVPFQKPLKFNCYQNFLQNDKSSDSITVQHTGKLDGNYILSDFFTKYAGTPIQSSLLSGEYTSNYTLNKENKLIDAIESKFSLHIGEQIVLSVQMEAYYLEEVLIDTKEDPAMKALFQTATRKKENSFMGSFIKFLFE